MSKSKTRVGKSRPVGETPTAPVVLRGSKDSTTLPGRDHRSTLLFLQTVEANNGGDVRRAATRGCAAGFPNRMRDKRCGQWSPEYGTRYDDGLRDGEHDDYDCLFDMEGWGFLEVVAGTGLQPVIRLTAKGHDYCAKLIRERGEQQRAEQQRKAVRGDSAPAGE